jgi:hypothetical protein
MGTTTQIDLPHAPPTDAAGGVIDQLDARH